MKPEVEAIIKAKVETVFLNKKPVSVAKLDEAVREACRAHGVRPPATGTVRVRVTALDPEQVLIKQGRRDRARDEYRPVRGEFPDEGTPLAILQMDHTQGDIILVDEENRLPVDRPWIIFGIDVNTRIVAGVYVTFEAPSAASAGMCMVNPPLIVDGKPLIPIVSMQMPGKPKETDFWTEMLSAMKVNAGRNAEVALQERLVEMGLDRDVGLRLLQERAGLWPRGPEGLLDVHGPSLVPLDQVRIVAVRDTDQTCQFRRSRRRQSPGQLEGLRDEIGRKPDEFAGNVLGEEGRFHSTGRLEHAVGPGSDRGGDRTHASSTTGLPIIRSR